MKPVIRVAAGTWRCGFTGGCWCYGGTPAEAYRQWRKLIHDASRD